MIKLLSTILAILGATLATTAFSQEILIVEPSQSAPIRIDPPKGFWRQPGEQIGTTETYSTYAIIGQFETQTGLSSSQTWVRVAPLNEDGTAVRDDSATGWVYWGENSLTESPNFSSSDLEVDSQTLRRELFEQIGN